MTNKHKLKDLKQHTLIISQLLCVRSLGTLNWILCSGSHQAKITRLVGTEVPSKDRSQNEISPDLGWALNPMTGFCKGGEIWIQKDTQIQIRERHREKVM